MRSSWRDADWGRGSWLRGVVGGGVRRKIIVKNYSTYMIGRHNKIIIYLYESGKWEVELVERGRWVGSWAEEGKYFREAAGEAGGQWPASRY